jgi:hypothetical protein
LFDGDSPHLDDCSNHDSLDCCTVSTHAHGLRGSNSAPIRTVVFPAIATDMTPTGISHHANAKGYHKSETVLQTIEPSHEHVQPPRFSQRILAASIASLPVFERSPAPSPPPSEERNAFQERQGIQFETAATPQKRQFKGYQSR